MITYLLLYCSGSLFSSYVCSFLYYFLFFTFSTEIVNFLLQTWMTESDSMLAQMSEDTPLQILNIEEGVDFQSPEITAPVIDTLKTKTYKKKEVIISKSSKEKAATANCRSKRTRTLFKKMADFIRETGLSAITIIKDYKGNFSMLASQDFEDLVLARKPLIDTRVNSILQYSDLKELSFKSSALPAVVGVSPEKTPPQLAFSLPGACDLQSKLMDEYNLHQGAPSSKLLEFPSPKEVRSKRTAVSKPAPKKPKKTVTKNGKDGSKNIKTALAIPSTNFLDSTKQPSSKDECCFPTCKRKWDKKADESWVECGICTFWACETCSQTSNIPQEHIEAIKYVCFNCRVT